MCTLSSAFFATVISTGMGMAMGGTEGSVETVGLAVLWVGLIHAVRLNVLPSSTTIPVTVTVAVTVPVSVSVTITATATATATLAIPVTVNHVTASVPAIQGTCRTEDQLALLVGLYGGYLMRVPMMLFVWGAALVFVEFVLYFKLNVDPGMHSVD